MKWIQERDALIAQTMAFVQSVTGRRGDAPAPAVPFAAPASVKINTFEEASAGIEPPPAAPPPPARIALQPRPGTDFRSEMEARIANFRKHQQRFEREREEYCSATLNRLRAAIRDASPPSPPSPPQK